MHALLLPRQLDEGAQVEPPSDHRGAFEQRELSARKLVEPGPDHRFDRRWDGKRSRGRVGGDRGELLEEERVPLGDRDDLRPRALRRSHSGEQGLRVGLHERPELDRLGSRRCRAVIEELGPPEPDQGDRHLRHERGEVVDEVVEGRLGPVRVVDDEHDWPLTCVELDETADCPKDLVRRERRRGEAAGGLEPLGEQLLVVLARERACDRLRPAGIPQDLDERPVRGAAVGNAPTGEDRRLAGEAVEQLVHEARLPDARRPDDRRDHGASLGRGALHDVAEPFQLLDAVDERAVEPTREAGRVVVDGHDAPGGDGVALPLRCEFGSGSRVAAEATSARVSAPMTISSTPPPPRAGSPCSPRRR